MRVSSETAQLDIAPGARADVTLDVVNTGSVIDGISARVIGMPDRNVSTRPAVLPLFPDSAGQLTVTLGLPQSFPAGRHPMTVEVLSRQPDTLPSYLNVDLVVPSAPAVGVTSRPELIRARRNARYLLTVTNRGNVTLEVVLKPNDPQKACAMRAQPPAMTLHPGTAREVVLSVHAPRHLMGTEIDRPLTVQVVARPTTPAGLVGAPALPGSHPGTQPGGDAAERPIEAQPLIDTAAITFRQRPYFTRGLMTALILVLIIALWAAAFLFGLGKVFAGDPMTKSAPPSFFAATKTSAQASGGAAATGTAGGTAATTGPGATGAATGPGSTGAAGAGGAAGAAGAGGAGGAGGAVPAAAPAGALPKGGAVPAGVGGTIGGTVIAASSGDPVGRILVEALRVKADGTTVPTPAASAATQTDGSFQVAGLFPASYLLRFSAPGFLTSYYPNATTLAAAKPVTVTATTVVGSGNAVVTGTPATITGKVDPGDATGTVITTVSTRLLKAGPGAPKLPIPDVTTKGNNYTIPNLPAPASYQLTFTTPGYQDSTAQVTVTGGAQRFESTVVLSAGNAQISGTVTDGTNPLGGATVSTTVAGQPITTGTPTTGQVGHFVIGNLPTPATYVITVSKDGYGQISQVVDLAPNKPVNNLTMVLSAGTGVVDGRLVDSAGVGIGGAKVTVGGMASPPSTVTLTNGAVGTFHLAGLPTPGAYTLTFSMAGFADQTVPVTLSASTPLPPITVTMVGSVGTITGTVTGPGGAGLTGATVTATDGQHNWPVITTGGAASAAAGSFTIANLPAGPYTVTAADPAGDSQTTLVTVTPGPPTTVAFQLTGG